MCLVISIMFSSIPMFVIFMIAFLLTLWNIIEFILYNKYKIEKAYIKYVEVISMFIGYIYFIIAMNMAGITFVKWDVPIHNDQMYYMISTDAILTIQTILIIAFISYLIIRFVPVSKLSPVVSAVGIAAIYLGIGVGFIFCIQTITYFPL